MKNYAEIMKTAHAMTRRTLARFPDADYRVTFAAALKIAHAEHGLTAAEIWSSYTPDEQYNALIAMTFYEYRRRDARINRKTGQQAANVFYWVRPDDVENELLGVAHSAYIRLIDYLQDDEKNTRPLARLMSHAVQIAAQRIARQEIRNGNALKQRRSSDDDGDNDELEYYMARSRINAEHAPSPESAAIVRDTIESALADDLDREIAAGLAQGYYLKEIAATLDVPYRTLKYRVARLRGKLDGNA